MSSAERHPVTLTCVEDACEHSKFVVSAKELERYDANGWDLPKRCPPCRDRRRKESWQGIH